MPGVQDPSMVQPADKGRLHGKCNRTACWNRPAICYSDIEHAYYCVKCAREINHWLPKNVKPINIPQEPPMNHLRINGVGRDPDLLHCIVVYTNKSPSDGELRVMHDILTDRFNTHGIHDGDIDPDATVKMEILRPQPEL